LHLEGHFVRDEDLGEQGELFFVFECPQTGKDIGLRVRSCAVASG
jgi:hypothetical protein